MSRRLVTALAAVALVAGCASGGKPKPAALQDYTPALAVRTAWSTQVSAPAHVPMPAARAGAVVVAGGDGRLRGLEAASGRVLWQADAGAPISAGVGQDGRFAGVVTRDNELVVFDAGRELWRRRLPARVATAPLVAGERVFVLGVDRVVQAFDALDGRPLWRLARPGEPLTLLEPGVLLAFKDTLLVGQGPRLAGVDPLRGTLRWEVAVALPRGANEVERLADLVGPAARNGDVVCVRAFQAAVGCVDAQRAGLLWSKNVGGVEAVAADARQTFGADASDRVSAWSAATGELQWSSDRLLNRGLSGAAVLERAVVFGDGQGYVHFLSREDGRTLQRVPTDGSAVLGTPLRLDDGTLLVLTRRGGVFALRAE